MPDHVLHYVYDPLCGWCYAAAPMVDAVRAAGVPLSLHGGGLWSSPTALTPGKGAQIGESDARIAALTDQPFGEAYLAGTLRDAAAVFWSTPATAAVLAAGGCRVGADLDMLHAIQVAHYVAGRRVVETDVLRDLAVGIGIDGAGFEAAYDLARAEGHIGRTRRLMGRAGVHGFPSFLVASGEALVPLPHEGFYGRPAAFADAISSAAARLVA